MTSNSTAISLRRKLALRFGLLLVCALTVNFAFAQTAGKVLLAVGDVSVVRGGERSPSGRGRDGQRRRQRRHRSRQLCADPLQRRCAGRAQARHRVSHRALQFHRQAGRQRGRGLPAGARRIPHVDRTDRQAEPRPVPAVDDAGDDRHSRHALSGPDLRGRPVQEPRRRRGCRHVRRRLRRRRRRRQRLRQRRVRRRRIFLRARRTSAAALARTA